MNRTYALVTAIALVASGFSAAAEQVDEPLLRGPRAWSFSRLKQILSESKPNTVAELLSAVDAKDPDFFGRWAFFKNSKSRQSSTLRDPRILAFASDASLILTFNGDPNARGYAVVEAMQFDPEKGYEFREIHFPSEGRERAFTEAEIEAEYGGAVLSKANPNECGICHGMYAPRPIWDGYSTWPGAIGGADDTLTFEERTAFDVNKTYWSQHPRYARALANFAPKTPTMIDPVQYSETNPEAYRRNLALNRLFSLQLGQLLVHDAAAASPELPMALKFCRSPYYGSSSSPSKSRERLDALYKTYAEDPALLEVDAHVGLFSSSTGSAASLQALIEPFGLDVVQYLPLQRQGAYFEDGGGGYRYFSEIIDEATDKSRQWTPEDCASFAKRHGIEPSN